jgi:hypothetical protein
VTADELLTTILNAGGQIILDPVRPRLKVPARLKPSVAEHRVALRTLVLARFSQGSDLDLTRFLGTSLEVLVLQGELLELRVPYFAQTLWFVPSEGDAQRLAAEGISRGRIWTARERDLLSCAGLRPDQVREVVRAKLEFGGDVVEVRPQ